jgi:hypothetical protein
VSKKKIIESVGSDVLAESVIATSNDEFVTVAGDLVVGSDESEVQIENEGVELSDTSEDLDDINILPADVPVFVDVVTAPSDEPLFFGEVSDRVMWLRDKFDLTPGKEFDVVLLSTIKSWQRENDFMPSGVFPVDEWNVLFNLV